MRRSLVLAVLLVCSMAPPAGAHAREGATEVTFFGAAPCLTICAYWIDNGFTPCEAPFPPGAYVDHITSPAPAPPPSKVMVLEVTLDNHLDWDGFLCANDRARTELFQLSSWGGECTNTFFFGCHEDGSTPVTVGQTVIFRAYNWSDALPATGRYWYLAI